VRLSVPVGSNNWYHLGVVAIVGGALVVAGGVMAFSSGS
jgi:hypothetical protein